MIKILKQTPITFEGSDRVDYDDDFGCVGDCSECSLFLDLKRCGYETNDSYHG